MPSTRQDPYLDFNFIVEIDQVASAGFSEAELPEGQIEAIAYREGTDNSAAARLLPGRVEYGPLVLQHRLRRRRHALQLVAIGGARARSIAATPRCRPCSTSSARRSPAGTSTAPGRRSGAHRS